MGPTHPRTRYGHVPLRTTRHIDALCDEFERTWKAGISRIEDFLERLGEEDRRAAFQELLELDIALRRRCQEKVDAEDYLQRFPIFKQVVLDAFCRSDVKVATVSRDSAAPPVATETTSRSHDSDSGHLEVRCPSC